MIINKVLSLFLLYSVLISPLKGAEESSETKRRSFKEVVNFVLDFSKGSRKFDEGALSATDEKPTGYSEYGSKVIYMFKNLTELENKRPCLLGISDQKAHWIFAPNEFRRKRVELRLTEQEVTEGLYPSVFGRIQSDSGMEEEGFLHYLHATLMYETLYIKQKGKERWGTRFPDGYINTNTLPLWYQSEEWLREQEATLRIP